MKVTLAKALSIKARLSSHISTLGERVAANNSRPEHSPAKFDFKTDFDQLATYKQNMIELKTKIQLANGPILGKIYLLAEAKGNIDFLKKMSTTHGVHSTSEYNRVTGQYDIKSTNYIANYDEVAVATMIAKLEQDIDTIQDELNTFNHTTQLELSFSNY